MTSTDTGRCEICKESLIIGEEVVQIHLNGNPHMLCWGCAVKWNDLSLKALMYLARQRDRQSDTLASWLTPPDPSIVPLTLKRIYRAGQFMGLLMSVMCLAALVYFLTQ